MSHQLGEITTVFELRCCFNRLLPLHYSIQVFPNRSYCSSNSQWDDYTCAGGVFLGNHLRSYTHRFWYIISGMCGWTGALFFSSQRSSLLGWTSQFDPTNPAEFAVSHNSYEISAYRLALRKRGAGPPVNNQARYTSASMLQLEFVRASNIVRSVVCLSR